VRRVDSLVRTVGWRPLVLWVVSLLPILVFHLHSAALLPLGWTHTPLRFQEAQPSGFAYRLRLGTEWMSHTVSRPSPARVLENGVPLAWPNALHQEIQHTGQGRYSLWHGWLVLSTSDNTDPRTNGRHYVLYWPTPLPPLVPLGCYTLVGVATLALGLVRARAARRPWVLRLDAFGRAVGWRPLVLWVVSLLPAIMGFAGVLYFFGALVTCTALVQVCLWAAHAKTNSRAKWLMHATVMHIPILLGLMMYDKLPR
jgi:hypothetical protein